jgi:acetylornithine deacetylase
MKIDPFAATELAGRIWGRGACDVKGAMAAMLAALSRIQAESVALPRTLVLAFTINEECGFTGIKTLCRLWDPQLELAAEAAPTTGPLSLAEVRELRPERALVAEPTLLDVVVAHKGSLRWRCHTHGKAAHTSRPERGVNAISSMVRVVQTIEQYQQEILLGRDRHPLCGQPTVCVSTIQGGTGVNTVPDRAVIDIDRRLTPEESPEQAYRELIDYIAQHSEVQHNEVQHKENSAATVEHELPTNQSRGLQDEHNRGWAEQIAATVSTLGPTSRLIGVPYGTNAWALSQLGIPTVVVGPGSIDQAHTADEWIDIQQLERATEVFYRLALAG